MSAHTPGDKHHHHSATQPPEATCGHPEHRNVGSYAQMPTNAHTPGPWRVISRTEIDGEPVTYVGQPERRGVDGHDYSLAWAENDVARVFRTADARLIAAAPRMLEMIRESLPPASIHGSCVLGTMHGDRKCLIAEARAILRDVEGESND